MYSLSLATHELYLTKSLNNKFTDLLYKDESFKTSQKSLSSSKNSLLPQNYMVHYNSHKSLSNPRPCVILSNMLFLYNEELLTYYPILKLKDHPLPAACGCLFNCSQPLSISRGHLLHTQPGNGKGHMRHG
jgi:hypothetical protein